MHKLSGNPNKIIVSRDTVNRFRQSWPCCKLRDRSYWFEFDQSGNLVDTDVPEQDDGPEAVALSNDAKLFWESTK